MSLCLFSVGPTGRVLWKKLNFHLQVVINWRLFLGQRWVYVSSSPFSSRTSYGADPCRPWQADSASGVRINFYLVDLKALFSWCPSSPLALRLFPPLLLLSSLNPEGNDLMETSHLGLSVSRSLLLSAKCLATDFCICSCMLQEEDYLMMMAEQGTGCTACKTHQCAGNTKLFLPKARKI